MFLLTIKVSSGANIAAIATDRFTVLFYYFLRMVIMQTFCQWVMVAQFAIAFLMSVYWDFNGHEAKQASGFGGFIGTVIAVGVAIGAAYGAGCFTVLLGQ